MNLEAPEVIVDLAQDDTWDQWECDKQIPRLAGEPRGLPVPRELADRIPAPQPHRDLPEARAGGAPGPDHRGLAWRPSSSTTSTASMAWRTSRSQAHAKTRLTGTSTSSRGPPPIRLPFISAPSPTVHGPAGLRFRSISRRTTPSRPCTGAVSACSGWMSRYRTSPGRYCPRRKHPPSRQTRQQTGTYRWASISALSATAAGRRRRPRRTSSSTSPSTIPPW